MKNKPRRAAFSLVELMVVIAIIGMLATIVTVSVIGQKDEADRTRVKADMKRISDALDLFRLNMGYYPNSLEELNQAPSRNASKWRGPYLKKFPPRDPWGNVYEYRPGSGRSGDFEIISYGADGAPGGVEAAADLSSKTIDDMEDN
ncbi:MAG: type II secretion system protein GspG [Planctomycetota bacterium]|nr:MAG: type II secretion system protein GspG [Planctomycetota bacterium]